MNTYRIFQSVQKQGHRICRGYPCFWKNVARQTGLFLSTDVEKGRTGTRGIWNSSAGFLNVRLFMTGIQQVFRGGTIIVRQLVPFLKTIEDKLGFRYPSVTADSGYESEEGYAYLRECGQKPYIKPQTYEKWKKLSFRQDISKRENMNYDEAADTYTCHAGRLLSPLYTRKQKSKSLYESEVTVYECEDCGGCPYKSKCTKAKGNKRLYLSKSFLEKRQESYENILSETGIRSRMNRSIQVEGAFGVLKKIMNFRDFCFVGKQR